MISPQKDCTKNDVTYNCSATGHPDSPEYTWTHWYWSPVTQDFSSTGATYTITDIGYHTLECATAYSTPSYCNRPGYTATCRSNITVKIFGEYIHMH